MGLTDEQLLADAVQGNADALCELSTRHAPAVRARLSGRISKRWQSVLTIDDVMQEAYVEAILSIGRFQPRGTEAFQRWLTSIAECTLVDALRMLEADKRGGDRRRVAVEAGSGPDLGGILAAATRSPSSCAALGEADAALQAAIERLPEAQRTVVRMRDFQNRPVEEVAAALNRTVGAVHLLRLRAHRRLCEMMGTSAAYVSRRA